MAGASIEGRRTGGEQRIARPRNHESRCVKFELNGASERSDRVFLRVASGRPIRTQALPCPREVFMRLSVQQEAPFFQSENVGPSSVRQAPFSHNLKSYHARKAHPNERYPCSAIDKGSGGTAGVHSRANPHGGH